MKKIERQEREKMKKKLLILMVLVLVVAVAACGQAIENQVDNEVVKEEPKILRVGASPVPHADILNIIKPLLAEEGIELIVEELQDYVTPNQFLVEGDLDANFFQHIPYLNSQNEQNDYGLVVVTGVHIEPMGGYSDKYKAIEDLPEGALILHPDAVSEEGRVLALLEAEGLIKLKEGVGFNGTVRDIVENPKKFEFRGVEAASLPHVYVDGDLAVINTNYALQAGLSPAQDALILEGPDNNPYVNVLATVEGKQDDPLIKKLAEALNSDEVRRYIEEKYKGNVVPAF
jgi:D-methionine transport system substrate-binding protein